MPSTFLQLTNKLLRRLNEVEIAQADFASVRGIQSTAKDCITDTVDEINTLRYDWPFNAVQHTQALEVGVEEYAWPSNFTGADWYSFQIQADDSLNVKHKRLKEISREEWYKNLKDKDDDSESEGLKVPSFVSPSHGQGWVVTPSPDQAYTIKYRYYRQPQTLVLYDDETSIPDKFDYVILAGALYHLNMFKENAEGAQLAEVRYNKGVNTMINIFLPNPTHAFSLNFNRGGTQRRFNNGFYPDPIAP